MLLTGLTHSREPTSLTVLLYFLGHLLDQFRSGDPAAVYVLETREIWFVPFVNPDGYIANQALSNKVIRKNRRPTCASSVNGGVDINRNFGIHWSGQFNGCNEEHGGTGPFSEPETQALKKLCEENKFMTAMNFHAFGGMLTHPYNWADKDMLPKEDKQIYREIGDVFGWPKFGPAIATVGYTAYGESDDWMYGSQHIISMSPEVGPESGDFWPGQQLIRGINERNFVRTLYVAQKSGLEFKLQAVHTPRGTTTLASSETSKLGELPLGLLDLSIQNAGLATSAGKVLGVAVQGAVRSGAAVPSGGQVAALVFTGGPGAQGAPVTASLRSDILSFQLEAVARRSASSLRLVVSGALEEKEGGRLLQVCVAEARQGQPQAVPVCHCGQVTLPAASNLVAVTTTSGRETFVLPGIANLGLLCSVAAGAVGTQGTSTSVGSLPASPSVVSLPASPLPFLQKNTAVVAAPVGSSSSGGLQPAGGSPVSPVPIGAPPDESTALWALFAMALTAGGMVICLLTQGFVKHRTSQVARRAPSTTDLERIPALQAQGEVDEDGDPLDHLSIGAKM
ncbi:unnamed protein product [Polarella glacialis]|uniref:Peptidase M14 domain-containing protein n=1 Tax=Polarella glacialis TaxID=89957 RepID=A0A813LRZ1_POLGL|nr:unnamed protein product [Polarella glacialis]